MTLSGPEALSTLNSIIASPVKLPSRLSDMADFRMYACLRGPTAGRTHLGGAVVLNRDSSQFARLATAGSTPLATASPASASEGRADSQRLDAGGLSEPTE